MGGTKASYAAQEISELLSAATKWATPEGSWARAISPAGIDYLGRAMAGYAGEELFRTIDWAMKWQAEDQIPPMKEFPIVAKLFTKDNTTNLAEIQEFYRRAEKIDRVTSSIKRMQESQKWEQLIPYTIDNTMYMSLAPAYAAARGDIIQLSRGLASIRRMPLGSISPENRREIERSFIKRIEMRAMTANTIARATMNSQ